MQVQTTYTLLSGSEELGIVSPRTYDKYKYDMSPSPIRSNKAPFHFEPLEMELKEDLGSYSEGTWEFPKIWDPNIVPQIVGSLL